MFGLPGSATTNMAEKCPAILLSSGVTLTNVEQWSLARQLSRQKLRGYGKENKLLRLKIPVFASRNVALKCNDISIKISSGFMLINEQRSLASAFLQTLVRVEKWSCFGSTCSVATNRTRSRPGAFMHTNVEMPSRSVVSGLAAILQSSNTTNHQLTYTNCEHVTLYTEYIWMYPWFAEK